MNARIAYNVIVKWDKSTYPNEFNSDRILTKDSLVIAYPALKSIMKIYGARFESVTIEFIGYTIKVIPI